MGKKPLDSRLKMSGMTEKGMSGTPSLSFPPVSPPSFPPVPLCHSRESGNPESFSSVPSFVCLPHGEKTSGFPIKNVGNDREEGMSGMTAEGMSGLLLSFPLVPLRPSHRSPFCPSRLAPSVLPAGLSSVLPAGPPPSFPPVPLLSFPQVVSGNPVFFFCPFLLCINRRLCILYPAVVW